MWEHLIMTDTRASGQRAIWLGIFLCAACLAYFQALDHILFSSSGFSAIFQFLLMPDGKTAWIAVVICLLAVFWNRPGPVFRLIEFLGERAVWVTLLCVAIFALCAVTVYHNDPLSMDEYAAVFQARIFAAGRISASLPPTYLDWLVVRGFNGEFLVASYETGAAIEKYWPGFALLLTPFEILRAPWLCNALLSGVALLLIHWITKEITRDKHAAGWALLFAIGSGAFWADAISYYSMQAHLTVNLLFVALLLRPGRWRACAAGLAGSLALILHSPVPHLLFASPWLIAMAVERKQWRYMPSLILGYLPGLGLGLAWLVLRSSIGAGAQDLSSLNGITNGVFTWPNAAVLNIRAASFVKMCLWAVPCLFVFAGLGYRDRRSSPAVRLLGASAILTFIGYFFVTFDQGHGWGYRYFHSAWGVIPILAGCAMTDRSGSRLRLVAFAGAIAILNLAIVVPFQMSQIERFVASHLAQVGPPRRPGNNVYFIHPRGGFYVADMVQIDPLLRDLDLYLVSRGAEPDSKMVLQNWPGAIKLAGGRAYDQWFLGPEDQRRAGSLIPPNAADR
jgi:hypothetical protein